MESAAITTKNIEQTQLAIQQLLQSKQASPTLTDPTDDQHHLLLSLLSQLESMKEEVSSQSETLPDLKEMPSPRASEVETKSKEETETSKKNTGVEAEDVVKELKKLEKQNRTTHWLLSALIVLTLAWQVSEVSILLKLKEGFSHPFKSVGNMVVGMVKRSARNAEEAGKTSLLGMENGKEKSENPLQLPNMPNMDLSGLINGDGE